MLRTSIIVLVDGKVSATEGRLWYQLGKLSGEKTISWKEGRNKERKGPVEQNYKFVFLPLEVHPGFCRFTEAVWTGCGHGFKIHQLKYQSEELSLPPHGCMSPHTNSVGQSKHCWSFTAIQAASILQNNNSRWGLYFGAILDSQKIPNMIIRPFNLIH